MPFSKPQTEIFSVFGEDRRSPAWLTSVSKKPAIEVNFFPDTDYKAYYWSRTPETRDSFRNMMFETTVQPEDMDFNNATANAFFQSYMLGADWRGPRVHVPL